MRLIIILIIFNNICSGQTQALKNAELEAVQSIFAMNDCMGINILNAIVKEEVEQLYIDTLPLNEEKLKNYSRTGTIKNSGVFGNNERSCEKKSIGSRFNFVYSKRKGLQTGDYHIRVYDKTDYDGKVYQLITIMHIGVDRRGINSSTTHVILRFNDRDKMENYAFFSSML